MPVWPLAPRAEPAAAALPASCRWLLPGVGGAVAWLRGRGIGAGSRIGISAANAPAVAALLQAAPLAGATLVLINHRLHPREAARQAADAGLALLVADAVDRIPGATAFPAAFADTPLEAPSPLARDAAQLVLFTSGTTGVPKAARLSRDAIDAAVEAAVATLGLTSSDAWLACLPLDHVGGAMTVLRAGACGCRLVLHDRFDAAAVDASLERDAVTGASLVPTMLHRLVALRAPRRWPATLRCLLTGGGPLDPALARRAADLGLAPAQTYGLTESASMATVAWPPRPPRIDGGAGRALPHLALRIAGPEPDGVGRIELRGAGLFDGYEGAGVLAEARARDAWFDTGDLGAVDAAGDLTVHCRRTDRIVSGGENVSPVEVEALLERHPAVAEAAVLGLPDPEWGQAVVALLVPRAGRCSEAALAAWLAAEATAFARPRRWRWVEELPRTALGKLARGDLARAWESAAVDRDNGCRPGPPGLTGAPGADEA